MLSRRTIRGPATGFFHTAVRTVLPRQVTSRGIPTLTDSRAPVRCPEVTGERSARPRCRGSASAWRRPPGRCRGGSLASHPSGRRLLTLHHPLTEYESHRPLTLQEHPARSKSPSTCCDSQVESLNVL